MGVAHIIIKTLEPATGAEPQLQGLGDPETKRKIDQIMEDVTALRGQKM